MYDSAAAHTKVVVSSRAGCHGNKQERRLSLQAGIGDNFFRFEVSPRGYAQILAPWSGLFSAASCEHGYTYSLSGRKVHCTCPSHTILETTGRRAAALPPVPVRRPWTVLGLKACHFRRVCNGRGKGTGHNEHRPPPHPDLVDSRSTAIPDVACLANPAAKRGNHARRLCCIIASCRSAMCQRTARHVHL